MIENIKLVYIDDTPDIELSKYFDQINQHYPSDEYILEPLEIRFDPEKDYSSLLKDDRVQTANIIVIDSRLFENRTATGGKFTGEEFKLVLQKFYPYIEVIVITQNEMDACLDMVPKYVKNTKQRADEYYCEIMPTYIERAIHQVMQNRILAKKMRENDSWEDLLKEKVLGTLSGTQAYDELTKSDIDTLIAAFRELKEHLNDR